MTLNHDEIQAANQRLRQADPADIIRWTVGLGRKTIASTSFGVNSGVLLHMISETCPRLPVIWVDSGYNTADTYQVAEALTNRLQTHLHVYTPLMTSERRQAIEGAIPTLDEAERHARFTRQVKLEPFERALQEHQPSVWISGIRKLESDYRDTLDIVSIDSRGILKIAPLFYWSDQQLERYRSAMDLPSCSHYFDPTKVHAGRECGLHSAA